METISCGNGSGKSVVESRESAVHLCPALFSASRHLFLVDNYRLPTTDDRLLTTDSSSLASVSKDARPSRLAGAPIEQAPRPRRWPRLSRSRRAPLPDLACYSG